MKMWTRRDEWCGYASCGEMGDIFTKDTLSDAELKEVKRTCSACRVRPECIQTALDEKWCSVVVAGILLPDPAEEEELNAVYEHLRKTLPKEFEARGDDI